MNALCVILKFKFTLTINMQQAQPSDEGFALYWASKSSHKGLTSLRISSEFYRIALPEEQRSTGDKGVGRLKPQHSRPINMNSMAGIREFSRRLTPTNNEVLAGKLGSKDESFSGLTMIFAFFHMPRGTVDHFRIETNVTRERSFTLSRHDALIFEEIREKLMHFTDELEMLSIAATDVQTIE